MQIYEFSVRGASPGIGGVIVVVAASLAAAVALATQECCRINEQRATRQDRPVRVDFENYQTPVDLPPAGGVVYSYDGEA